MLENNEHARVLCKYMTRLPSSRVYKQYDISGDVIVPAVDVQPCGVNG